MHGHSAVRQYKYGRYGSVETLTSSGVEASSKNALNNRNDIDAAFDNLEKCLMLYAGYRKGNDTWSSTNEPRRDAMEVRMITLESKPAAGSIL